MQISSIGGAEYHLNALAGFNSESEALQKGSVVEIKKWVSSCLVVGVVNQRAESRVPVLVWCLRLGKVLLDEKFEHSTAVAERETAVDKLFEHLNKLSAHKQEVLDDALTREKYKEKVRGWAQQHVEKHKKLSVWLGEKKSYLETEEKISSVRDAQIALSLLSAYEDENKSLVPASVPSLHELGSQINSAEFKTAHSDVRLAFFLVWLGAAVLIVVLAHSGSTPSRRRSRTARRTLRTRSRRSLS
jgi:hypothetical protein